MQTAQYGGVFDWIKEKLEELKSGLFGERFVTRFEKVEPLRCPGCFRCYDKLTQRWINCNFDTTNAFRYNLEIRNGYLVIVKKHGSKVYYYRVPEKYCRGKVSRGRIFTGCTIALQATIANPKDLYLVVDNGAVVYKAKEPAPGQTEPVPMPRVEHKTETTTQQRQTQQRQQQTRQQTIETTTASTTGNDNIKKMLPYLLGGALVIILLSRR